MNIPGPVTVREGKKEDTLHREDLESQIPLDNKKEKTPQHASSDEALHISILLLFRPGASFSSSCSKYKPFVCKR